MWHFYTVECTKCQTAFTSLSVQNTCIQLCAGIHLCMLSCTCVESSYLTTMFYMSLLDMYIYMIFNCQIMDSYVLLISSEAAMVLLYLTTFKNLKAFYIN